MREFNDLPNGATERTERAMDGISRIVCGIDFSEEARQAARVAGAWTRCTNAALTLVHVIDELGAEEDFAREPHAPRYADRRAALDREADAVAREFEVKVDRVLTAGAAADRLVETAQQSRATLVVVASLGQRKRHRWLLGSVAERVSQLSSVPVLVVKISTPLIAWAVGQRRLRVLAAVDFTAASRAVVHWISNLRSCAPCDVQFTRVIDPAIEHARLGYAPPAGDTGVAPNVERLLRRELRRWTGGQPGEGVVSWSIRSRTGRLEFDLAHEAERVSADLLAVGSPQRARTSRSWRGGSTSQSVLHIADVNTLVVPAGSGAGAALTTINRILVCTDFTEAANRALPVAYGLVNRGGVVHLVHVVADDERATDERLADRLRALVPAEADSRGIVTTVELVRSDEAADGILQIAERRGVDAICLATRARTAVSKMVLGSTAERVVSHARQPVVLIPPDLP
jgi:nucleotide-binding universal stress UspA family protein